MPRTLRVAVVGVGNIAQMHLPVLRDTPGVHIVALADKNPQTLRETADRFGIEHRLDSHRPLLGEQRPDAAFVLVSVLSVAEVASEFIKAGIPTFLEKPPGLYTHQTRHLAELSRQHNTLAMVGVNRRFYSTVLRGREMLLEAGPIRSVAVEALGDLRQHRIWERQPAEVVRRWSVANEIHVLDLLRFFGGDAAKVTAVQRTFEGPMPDTCFAIVEFQGGALGRATIEWHAPGSGHRFEVRGQAATLTSDMGLQRVAFERRGHSPVVLELDEEDRKYKAGFLRQDQTFLECVRTGQPLPFPACDLDDAVKTMEMIDLIAGTS